MRIALIAPPFIPIPPVRYGGTELFLGHLAAGLKRRGVDVVLYTNGESTIDVEKRWLYEQSQWPIEGDVFANIKDVNHTAWAVRDAAADCDILHLNNAPGLVHSHFVAKPFVCTMHHVHDATLTDFYSRYPGVQFVTISDFQKSQEPLPSVRTIHHGIDLNQYKLQERKQPYLSFIGRIAPVKGVHLAIEVAKRAKLPLKIAGEVQPMFRDYFEREIQPHIDGHSVEYLGEADLDAKNELLGNSFAMLFPIQWHEPFGLVMLEAMACGTPVIALGGGSVPEVVREGVSGWICEDVNGMIARAMLHLADAQLEPKAVRAYVEQNFSVDRMVDRYLQLYRELLSRRTSPATAA